MPAYNTSEFRKGLKVQIDGDPYILIECNFVKPGKGQALYKCKLRNLLRNTVLDRTYKSGDSLDAAERAAWMLVARAVMNLDETIMKR